MSNTIDARLVNPFLGAALSIIKTTCRASCNGSTANLFYAILKMFIMIILIPHTRFVATLVHTYSLSHEVLPYQSQSGMN